MSKEAVSLSIVELLALSNDGALDLMIDMRWGGRESIECPHCCTVGKHIWRGHDRRWKCKGCGSSFSVTSGTVFSGRKMPLQDLLVAILMYINSAGGQPALELKRHLKRPYNTCYALQHKMREGFGRGFNVGLISGDIEVDGAHTSGRNAAGKRGRPQANFSAKTGTDAIAETNARSMRTPKILGGNRGPLGPKDTDYGRRFPVERRLVMNMRKRSGVRGKGACDTRVVVDRGETPEAVAAMFKEYIAMPESFLNTDGSTSYSGLAKRFMAHRVVDHSKTFSGPNGENNNQAEEYNMRLGRAEAGIHLHIGPKYLYDYAAEMAFRSDTRRMPNGAQFKYAMHIAMSVGVSRYWVGFTHGRHRRHEIMITGNVDRKSSGPPKGRNPNDIWLGPPR
jgi:transposase-like protein